MPYAQPSTIADGTSSHTSRACAVTAPRTSPAASTSSPAAAARLRPGRRSRRRARGWIRIPASAQSAAIAAVSAMPLAARPAPAKLGSSANAIAGAANTHGAIGATTVRKRRLRSPGVDRRGTRRWPAVTVSGACRSSTHTTAMTARWGRYGSTVGDGAHCATNPATRGPSANPEVMATAARRAAV